MEAFRKLPSGNWNLRVYDYTGADGKKHYKTFTGATKADCRKAANKWSDKKEKEQNMTRCTVLEAANGYIDLKRSVLSPSTIRFYEGVVRNQIEKDPIGRIQIEKLTTPIVQRWVSWIAADHEPKTVRNCHGFLMGVLSVYAPDLRLRATLPQAKLPDLYCPDETDITTLLAYVRAQNDVYMEIAILLAIHIPARRGEICALTHEDIDGNLITINKSLVKTNKNTWVQKQPKTAAGYRTVEVSDFVIRAIPEGKGRIIPWHPDYLTNRFIDYVKACGIPHFRFHDLRHYGASMMLTVMSPRYVQHCGGWSSTYVMNKHYNNVIDLEMKRQTKKAQKMFDKKLKYDTIMTRDAGNDRP